MGERESQQAATESRRDVTGRPPTHLHEDALRRFLGAAFYQHARTAETKDTEAKDTEAKDTEQQPGKPEAESDEAI